MVKGRVYWVTGLPGSGKTMIGTTLYYRLKQKRDNVVILDGDILKSLVGDVVGYEKKDRLARGKRYSKICKLLSDQGIGVIICTVAMFNEVRRWNRDNISGYIEVFLNPPMDILKKRNRKNLYNETKAKDFLQMEFPLDPDIVLANGDGAPINDYVERIVQCIPRNENDFDRDTGYWDKYYKRMDVQAPSSFAHYVLEDLKMGSKSSNIHFLELGCGNGRDSVFFVNEGYRVTAIDASEQAIFTLQKKFQNKNEVRFICDDFTRCRALFQTEYDVIYMRWVLHAISLEQETELFQYLKEALNDTGKIYIEARTIHDDLFGLGEAAGDDAFIYHGHYRRFVNLEKFKKRLQKWGYSVLFSIEDKNFSKTEDEDPTLCRLILSKIN